MLNVSGEVQALAAFAPPAGPNEHWNALGSFEVQANVALGFRSGLGGFCESVITGGVASSGLEPTKLFHPPRGDGEVEGVKRGRLACGAVGVDLQTTTPAVFSFCFASSISVWRLSAVLYVKSSSEPRRVAASGSGGPPGIS